MIDRQPKEEEEKARREKTKEEMKRGKGKIVNCKVQKRYEWLVNDVNLCLIVCSKLKFLLEFLFYFCVIFL